MNIMELSHRMRLMVDHNPYKLSRDGVCGYYGCFCYVDPLRRMEEIK